MLSLAFFRMSFRKRLYISWVGLRGAVPIVFATYPLLAGIEKADMIFNIVFFVSLTSVIIQGTTLPIMAKWLHVALPERVKRRVPAELFLSDQEKTSLVEIIIPKDGFAVNKKVVDLHFPTMAIIAMIKRGEKYITPGGSSLIEAGEKLMILSETQEGLEEVYKCLKIQ